MKTKIRYEYLAKLINFIFSEKHCELEYKKEKHAGYAD